MRGISAETNLLVVLQVQTMYRRTPMRDIATKWRGSIVVLLLAVLVGILESQYHFMTAPHEYGHVMAARLVGHRVRQFQVSTSAAVFIIE